MNEETDGQPAIKRPIMTVRMSMQTRWLEQPEIVGFVEPAPPRLGFSGRARALAWAAQGRPGSRIG
jgi:hypothetical protein